MGTLTVRNVEDAVIRSLKIRAAHNGRSAEAEHREILRRALGAGAPETNAYDFFRNSPLRGVDLEGVEDRSGGEPVDLG